MIHGYHLLPAWQDFPLADLPRRGLAVDSGRGGVCLLDHPKATLVERPYRHGGLRRKLLPQLFLKSERAAAEFNFHLRAFDGGVATVQPVGWREQKTVIPFARHYFYYSVLLPEAVTLAQFLDRKGASRGTVQQMAAIVHRLYELSIYHHDLNLNNWLVAKQKIYLIDFDRARQISWDAQTFLHTVLARIARSGRKLGFLSLKRAFFRLTVIASKRFGLEARKVIKRLPASLANITSWDKLRWQLTGGHQKGAQM